MKRLSVMLALLLAFALPAFAQIQGGSISGTIKDEQGGVLPGVTVSAQGVDATQTFVTEASGEYPLPEPRARPVQGHRRPARLHHRRPRGRRRVGRQERRAADDAEDRAGRRDDHRQRRVAGDRHQGDRHVDQLHLRRADQDSDLARSVRADALGAGRARRSRQHRRQRDRPAVQLRVEGHAAAGRGVDDGRDQHHRHGGDRRVAQLLQLRQLRGDPGLDRRPGHQAADRRHGAEPRRQARHQRVPRRRPRLLRQPRDGVDQRAGRARRRRRHAARRRITTSRSPTTASISAGRSCATRRGSTARTRSRTCSWCGAPARWSTRPS